MHKIEQLDIIFKIAEKASSVIILKTRSKFKWACISSFKHVPKDTSYIKAAHFFKKKTNIVRAKV